MKFISIVLFFLPFVLTAQSNCADSKFLSDSIYTQSKTDSVTWFKIKAKGGKLDLKVLNLKSGSHLSYTLFTNDNCEKTLDSNLLPLRKINNGLACVSEEKWQILVDKGYCACDQCFSKITFDPNSKLNVIQDQYYLLKVESKGLGIQLKFLFSEVALKEKKFDLKSNKNDLEIGMVYCVQNIHFKESSMEYTVPNPPELNELLGFMTNNPSVKIEVQGHINGPFNTNPELAKVKSNERALKIKSFLTVNGIEASRISTKGFGSTKMRYPIPKSEWESEQNRRIEVMIIGL